jgi:hypothetical protein
VKQSGHPYVLDSVWQETPERGKQDIHALMRVYGVMPAMLFSVPHPMGIPKRSHSPEIIPHICPIAPLFIAGKVADYLWMLDVTGKLLISEFNVSLSKLASLDVPVSPTSTFAILGDGLLGYDAGKFTVHRRGGASHIEVPLVDRFEASGSTFVSLRNGSMLSLFDARFLTGQVETVAITDEVVLCFAVSETFHVVVAATRDNALHFYSLRKLKKRAIVRMPVSCAQRIEISPSWGLVIVGFGMELAIFSINGERIARYRHDCEITCWRAVSARTDFDFVVLADVRGNLFATEACRPERRIRLTRLPFAVRCIEYSALPDVLAVVSAGGSVTVIARPFGAFQDG